MYIMVLSDTLKYDTRILMIFCFIGIMIKLFVGKSNQDGSDGPANATMWGYGLVNLSVFSIMFITFGLATQMTNLNNLSSFGFIKKLILYSLPSILMLIILSWIITLNSIYRERINKNMVPAEYNNISFLSSLLILVQLGVLFKILSANLSGIPDPKELIMRGLSIVLFLLNIAFNGIMTIILKYFTTDG